MTPNHKRTIEKALLADNAFVRERLSMLGVYVIEVPSLQELWEGPLAKNLVLIGAS